MADLTEITEFLDDYLGVAGAPDYPGAWNGLQVACRSPIEKVCTSPDAARATIESAAGAGAQMLLVHHGLFWENPLPVTGSAYRRLRALFDADMALYSVHLPLDLHPAIGNNVLLAGALGLPVEGRFGTVAEVEGIGVWSATDLSLRELSQRIEEVCGDPPHVIAGGPEHVRRVGLVTGGGASLIRQAHAEGLDTFITGEGGHHSHHLALELGLNVLYAGHYATETMGIRALGELVAERFDVEAEFLDVPTGL
ncbi:MAG: Nif3-like dinuclear metal center hexameric protein [Gemmatimonadota bacterium]